MWLSSGSAGSPRGRAGQALSSRGAEPGEAGLEAGASVRSWENSEGLSRPSG